MVRSNNNKNKNKSVKAKPRSSVEAESPERKDNSADVLLQLHQKILNIFQDALKPNDDDKKLIQEVKGHLFNRDFATAFGNQEYLRVYASRWSPSRALGYLSIFANIESFINQDALSNDQEETPRSLKVICIGGGAGAELVSLSAWISFAAPETEQTSLTAHARLLDIAPWNQVTASLYETITTPPPLSKYASASARAANVALLSKKSLSIDFRQQDILSSENNIFEHWKDTDLVTLMFTLNELYSTSMIQTQKMLAKITATMQLGSHLLVVDSPGSYSTVSINGAEKKYPMHWLLDHTMLDGAMQKKALNDVAAPKWEKLVSNDSRWFRLPQGLEYPLDLENMRYQIHLYRRVAEDVQK